jgi:uncharacterized protein
VTSPIFTFVVAEIERDGQLDRSWEIPTAWLSTALSGTDAHATDKPGHLTAQVFKNGQDFVVRGSIRVLLQLPCARTLEPAFYDLTPELFLVLRRKPGVGDRARPERAPKTVAQRKKANAEEADRLLTDEDASSDTFSGDVLALDHFVREQVLLDLPMFPLRSDLRSRSGEGIPPPPHSAAEPSAIDPRLAPLQALKAKLKG